MGLANLTSGATPCAIVPLRVLSVLIVVLITAVLAVARLTRLFVEDRITNKVRLGLIRRYGEQSLPAYFIHCPWCMSIWFAVVVMPVAVLWPNRWVLAGLAIPAASYLTGIFASRWERN